MDQTVVTAMTESLRHRGPDDAGVHVAGPIGLGHRRLSIIDLSEAGHQPMTNADWIERGRSGAAVWLTYNGEIYNYRELRRDLEQRGHQFHSQTDTEVILHLYEEYGEGCVERLRGMFAFAVWDDGADTLLLARDRAGQKPLLYAVHDGVLYFASEIQGLLCVPGLDRSLDPAAIREYFNFFYVSPPGCMFGAIHKLPPATTLTVANGGQVQRRYWQPAYEPKRTESESQLVDMVRERLDDAVRMRLMSDVPLGSMLSGGLDSTLVTAMARRHAGGRLKTFSAFYADEDGRDADWAYAQLAAERLGVEHHNCFYTADDLLARLPTMVRHYGEPHAIITTLVSTFLAEQMAEHVTVVLSGNGGDEVFGGYRTYQKVAMLNSPVVQRMLDAVPSGPARWLRDRLQRGNRAVAGNLGMALYAASLSNAERRTYNVATGNGWLRDHLFTDAVNACDGDPCDAFQKVFAESNATQLLDAWLHTDLMSRMQEYTVVQPDLSGMAHSLEIRSPLLDHEVIELAAALPTHMKVRRWRTTKYMLRRVAAGLIPDEVIHRSKTGFAGVTYARLIELARGPWRGTFEDALFGGHLQASGYFQPRFIESAWRSLQKADARGPDHTRLFQVIWSLVVFEHWWREMVQAPSIARPTELVAR